MLWDPIFYFVQQILMRTFYVSSTMPGTGDIVVSKIDRARPLTAQWKTEAISPTSSTVGWSQDLWPSDQTRGSAKVSEMKPLLKQ